MAVELNRDLNNDVFDPAIQPGCNSHMAAPCRVDYPAGCLPDEPPQAMDAILNSDSVCAGTAGLTNGDQAMVAGARGLMQAAIKTRLQRILDTDIPLPLPAGDAAQIEVVIRRAEKCPRSGTGSG